MGDQLWYWVRERSGEQMVHLGPVRSGPGMGPVSRTHLVLGKHPPTWKSLLFLDVGPEVQNCKDIILEISFPCGPTAKSPWGSSQSRGMSPEDQAFLPACRHGSLRARGPSLLASFPPPFWTIFHLSPAPVPCLGRFAFPAAKKTQQRCSTEAHANLHAAPSVQWQAPVRSLESGAGKDEAGLPEQLWPVWLGRPFTEDGMENR